MPTARKTNSSSSERSLEVRVYAVYASLSPAEKRLADVLLQHQRDLPSYTSGEMAREAGVSKATAARLVRALGYETYGDAKRQVRNMRHWGSPQAGLADPDAAPTGRPTLAEMARTDIENIHTTVESVPTETLDGVCGAIVGARRVWIAGMRSGYGLAQQTAHYLTLLKPDVQVLSAGGGYSHDIASIVEGDVLFVVAFRRRPRLLPKILKEAEAAGATTVLLTDLSAGASAKNARFVLRCRCHSPSPFNSFSAAVTLVNYIAWSVASQLGEESLKRFRTIDHLVAEVDDVSRE